MIVINLDNISGGMVIKNYKELCDVLGEDVKTGGAKKNQLKWFEEYFTYEKEGNKFIITHVSDKEVMPMEDNRGGSFNTYEYTENIEMLLLDLLAQDKNDGTIFLSKNKLFHLLEMVNVNYLDTNRRVPKLSKFLDINESSVQEWFDSTGGLLERSLNSALNKLAKQSLIFWSREITICKVKPIAGSEYLVRIVHKDSDGEESEEYIQEVKTRRVIEEASNDEKKYILKIEKETMDKLGCENKQEIIAKGLWDKFENTVKEILKTEKGIIYYFQSYKILFNQEHIIRKQNQLENLLLDRDVKKEQKQIINSSIIDKNNSNALARHDKALDKIKNSDIIDSKSFRRSSEDYIKDNAMLNDTLINKKAKDIRNKVRAIKLKE